MKYQFANLLKKEFLVIIFFVFVCLLFFYKTIVFGQIPFPGDILINDNPYRTESYLGYAPGGYPNKAQGRDVIHEMYPWKVFSISELKKGKIPFWNPYNFSGNLHMQNFQTGIFYPFNIIFFFLPFATAWAFFIILKQLLAAFFMYLYLRKQNLHGIASVIGGIAFSFSSYFVVWIEYGNIGTALLWLPLALLFIDYFIKKRRWIYFYSLVVILSISLLGGYIQGTFYLYVFLFLYALYKAWIEKKLSFKLFLDLTAIGFLPFILTAFQILPTLNFFRESTRGAYSLKQIDQDLNSWYYLITVFIPDFFGNPATRNFWLPITYIERVMYVGIPILFFSFYAVAKIRTKQIYFFFWFAVISLLLCTNIPGIKFLYLIPVPIISTTVPTRALCLFIINTIILASYGVDYWLREKKTKSKLSIIFMGFYFLIWLIVLLGLKLFPQYSQNLHVSLHNLIIPTVLVIATVIVFYFKNFNVTIASIGLIGIVIFDLFYFFYKITPFSPTKFIYPQTPVISYIQKNGGINRFWGYGSGYIPPNLQTYDKTFSPEGDDPLHLKSYGELLASSEEGSLPNLLPRPDANIAPGYGNEDLKMNTHRQTILNLLGVKYIVFQSTDPNPDLAFSNDLYNLVWRNNSWHIYENKKALPRYFIASHYIVAKDKKDAIAKIYNGTSLAATLILFQKPKEQIDQAAKGTVKLIDYQPEKIILQTQTTGNALLFLSDNYHPYWHATVDKNPATIYNTDYTFRSVVVPRGNHTVTMTFVPEDFYLGIKIALAGLIITILYGYVLWKNHKKI